jgi:hypothetical protein
MKNEQGIKAGDTIAVGKLQTKALDIVDEYGETFVVTEYGNFNIDLVKKTENNE